MSNEITVRLKCDIKEMCNILENKEFKVIDKYSLDDTYYISNNIDIRKLSSREILNSYILIRRIKQFEGLEHTNSHEIIKITYKSKNIVPNGEIISQEKVDCEVTKKEDGKKFIEAIGYHELMNIKENTIVYGKGQLKIAIKNIENEDKLIEIETIEKIMIQLIN